MLSWFQLSPMEWDAIHLSMSVALSSMLWSLPFAIFIAWLLARKEFYGKSLITGIIHLPFGVTASGNRLFIISRHGGVTVLSVSIYINGLAYPLALAGRERY